MIKFLRHSILVYALFCLPLEAKQFKLDPKRSSAGFSVKHLNLLPVKGNFAGLSGEAVYDAQRDMITRVHVKIDADTIDTKNDDRDAHLKSKDFFHVRSEVYDLIPENRYIEFQASTVAFHKAASIQGSLKILKVEKTVNFQIDKKNLKKGSEGDEVELQVSGSINRQHFGLTWQKPSTGLKEKLAGKFVGDEVSMMAKLVFVELATGAKEANGQSPPKEEGK